MSAEESAQGAEERVSRIERLLNLLGVLLATREFVTARMIRETVTGYMEDRGSESAFQKRFARDLQELEAIGVPVEYEAPERVGEVGGYRVRRESYYLPRLRLEPIEALLLDQLAETVRAGDDSAYAHSLRSAIRKLLFDRPGPEEDPGHGLGKALLPALAMPGGERDLTLALAGAAGRRQVVRLSYYSIERDEATVREVEPYGLRFVGGHWYMVGRDCGRDQLRTYRLSRIAGTPQPLGSERAFFVPDDFRLEDHVPRGPWGFGGSGPAEVLVRFDDETAWMVQREVAGEGRVRLVAPAGDPPAAERQAAGAPTQVMHFSGGNLSALTRYLARYLDHVEVLEPAEARGAYRDLAAAARAHYAEVAAPGGGTQP